MSILPGLVVLQIELFLLKEKRKNTGWIDIHLSLGKWAKKKAGEAEEEAEEGDKTTCKKDRHKKGWRKHT